MTSPQAYQDDPFGGVKQDKTKLGPTAREVNLIHANSDIDSGPSAGHHSLGVNRNQASPGDHVHDGKASKLLGAGMHITISGSKGGNAALTSLIAALKQVISITDNTT